MSCKVFCFGWTGHWPHCRLEGPEMFEDAWVFCQNFAVGFDTCILPRLEQVLQMDPFDHRAHHFGASFGSFHQRQTRSRLLQLLEGHQLSRYSSCCEEYGKARKASWEGVKLLTIQDKTRASSHPAESKFFFFWGVYFLRFSESGQRWSFLMFDT